jgi:hypothetical protein
MHFEKANKKPRLGEVGAFECLGFAVMAAKTAV